MSRAVQSCHGQYSHVTGSTAMLGGGYIGSSQVMQPLSQKESGLGSMRGSRAWHTSQQVPGPACLPDRLSGMDDFMHATLTCPTLSAVGSMTGG